MKTIEQLASILKLANIRDNFKSIISEAMDNNASYEDFLKLVLN